MGYNTDFTGEIKFNRPLTAGEFLKIKKLLEEHSSAFIAKKYGYKKDPDEEFSWINLEITDDGSGIRWDESEKTYGMVTSLNVVMHAARTIIPDLEFSGEMMARGEETGDVWRIRVKNSVAAREEVPISEKVSEVDREILLLAARLLNHPEYALGFVSGKGFTRGEIARMIAGKDYENS